MGLYPDEAIKRTTAVCEMTDAQAMQVIADLRREVGELRTENKWLKKELRRVAASTAEGER